MQAHVLYDYLCAARARLFDWIRPLSKEQYEREFPYGLKTIHATLLHTAGAEWLYGKRVHGQPATIADVPFRPEKMTMFAVVEAEWEKLAKETRTWLKAIKDWDTSTEWRGRIPTQGPNAPTIRFRTTKGGIASQLLFHEVHHRSQVMSMLRQLGVAAQNLDYSVLRFDRKEEPAEVKA
ncbi:MAG: DinB family protein [bacterium]